MKRVQDRDSHPLLRLLALAAVLVVIGFGLKGVGLCIGWMSHTQWGANP